MSDAGRGSGEQGGPPGGRPHGDEDEPVGGPGHSVPEPERVHRRAGESGQPVPAQPGGSSDDDETRVLGRLLDRASESGGDLGEPPQGTRPPGRRYLLDSERRVIFVRRHPALLLRYVLETVGALLVAGLFTAVLPDDFALLDVLWYLVLGIMARLLYQVAEWSADRFVVTDRRMMLISGLLTRKVAMMPLTKVTDMTYEKPIVGRLLGYGEFVMESAGQDQALHRIRYVPAPDRLYREVSELLFGGATASPKVVPSTAKARGAPSGQPSE